MPPLRKTKKPKEPSVYKVTFEGLYFAKGPNGSHAVTKPYKITVKLNDKHKDAGFLSVAKNLVLPQLLPKSYEDFQGIYTHEIKAVENLTNPDMVVDDPDLMSYQQLAAYVQYHELPINLDLYPDADDLRQALKDCDEDEEAFKKLQKNRYQLKRKEIGLAADLAELNEEFQSPETRLTSFDPATVPGQLYRPPTPKIEQEQERDPVTGELVPIDRFTGEDLERDPDAEEEDPLEGL